MGGGGGGIIIELPICREVGGAVNVWECLNRFQFSINWKFDLSAPCFKINCGRRMVEQTFRAKVGMVPARTKLEVLLVGGGFQRISTVATILKLVVVCNAGLQCFLR